ncbi:hypothetical protein KLP40_01335 [Hymenobacter sp. NST-14]|uniref:hypothetical protein n=1 Tax=Hymenobacter piscis TaxID=2839984 RepID=UPI001C017B09|nr:hypothetical protein [Hymenobacter piscis]MBT9391790.1 hypothetical protein [Hymenobacter piscis]
MPTKKPKSALKYFARLIELGGLSERHTTFHEEYVRMAEVDPRTQYDPDKGTVTYEVEHFMTFGAPAKIESRDLGREVCAEVQRKTVKSKERIYERLTAGLKSEREWSYKQMMRDLEKWKTIVAREPLYAKYPCVAAALLELSEYALSYNPLQPETDATPVSASKIGHVVGFHYVCRESGLKADRVVPLTKHCLGNLFSELRDKLQLIAPETSLDDFRTLFSGKVVLLPVRWIGTNNQLHHFIKSIESKLVSPGTKRLARKWEITAGCFVSRKGEPFTSNSLMCTGYGNQVVKRQHDIEHAAKLLR